MRWRMNVVYDISVLGAGHVSRVNRTGVFRTVEHLAEGLARSGECALHLSAREGYRAYLFCREYLKTNPRLGPIPLLAPAHGGMVRALARPVSSLDRRTDPGLAVKVLRRGMVLALRAAERPSREEATRRLSQADVFHVPSGGLPAPGGRAQRFLTVHDLIPVLFPDLMDEAVVRKAWRSMRGIRPTDWVLANSECTRNDLCEHFGIDPARVFVTPFAASAELFHPVHDAARARSVRRRYGIPDGPYLLALNTLEPRKNMDHAIRAFTRLARQEKLHDLAFVLVGTKGWRFERIFEAVEGAGELRDRIILAGYVADEDLAALYSGALAFVYPSLYEGFGLPPLEAMQCGTPVITSNTSSLPEVVGGAGVLLDPADADGLSQAILELYRTPSLRDRMSQASLERASRFSWERCTRDTLAAYRSALAA